MPSQIDELEDQLRELLRRKADAVGSPAGLQRTLRQSTRRLARNVVVALVALGLVGSGAAAGVRSLLAPAPTRPANQSPSPFPTLNGSASLIPVAPRHDEPGAAGRVRSGVSTKGTSWFNPTPGSPLGIAAADGKLWVVSGGNIGFPAPSSYAGIEAGVATLARLDFATGEITTTEVGPPGDVGLAVAFGDAWVLRRAGEVIRVAGGSLKKTASIQVSSPSGAAADDSSLWVMSLSGMLTRIDPRTNQVVASIDTGVTASKGFENNGELVAPNSGVPATGVSIGAGAVWVRGGGRVVRIDPGTNAVQATIDVGGTIDGLAAGPSDVWASACIPGGPPCIWQLVRIDPATNSITSRRALGRWKTSATPREGSTSRAWVTFDSGSVWVSLAVHFGEYGRGKIVRIDPATGEIVTTLLVPGSTGVIYGMKEELNTSDVFGQPVIAGGWVWVINLEADEVVRIDLPAS